MSVTKDQGMGYKTFSNFASKFKIKAQPMGIDQVRNNIDEIRPFHLRCEVLRALKKNKDYAQEGNYFGKTMQRSPQGISNLNKKITVDENNLIEKVRDFNKTYADNMSIFRELKEENEYFTNKYEKAKKGGEEKVVKIGGGNLNVGKRNNFQELIVKYREKGYKIPDLSVKKNLFEPSSLLMENNKINDYYKFVDFLCILTKEEKERINFDKDLFYLQNLGLTLNDKITSEEENRKFIMERTRTMRERLSTTGNNNKNANKTMEEIIKENNQLEREIKIVKELKTFKDKAKRDKIKNLTMKSNKTLIRIESNKSFVRPQSPTEERIMQKMKIKSALKTFRGNNITSPGNTSNTYYNNTSTTGFETFSANRTLKEMNRLDTRIDTRSDDRIDPRFDTRSDNRIDPRSDNRSDPHNRIDHRFVTRSDNRTDTQSSYNPKQITTTASIISLNKQKTRNIGFKSTFNKKKPYLNISECEDQRRAINTPTAVSTLRNNLDVSTIAMTPKGRPKESSKSVKVLLNGETIDLGNYRSEKNNNMNTIPSFTSIHKSGKKSRSGTRINTAKASVISDINLGARNKRIEELYEKLANKDYTNVESEIKQFYSDFKGKDLSSLENENVKPHDQLKYINELKNKVAFTNFMDIYNNYTTRNGPLKINTNELKKVKDLDEEIWQLDFLLVKELRKLKKE